MPLPRGGLVAIVALAAIATAGTGFAAFTSSAFINASGEAGTVGPLVWGPSPAYGGFAPNDLCTASVGTTNHAGDTLYLTAGNLAPGDICSYGDTLHNLGSLPAATSERITSASGALCAVLAFGDNFFSPSIVIAGGGEPSTVPHTIAAGGDIQWAGFLHLLPSAGNAYGGQSCSFVVTVTGSAGT